MNIIFWKYLKFYKHIHKVLFVVLIIIVILVIPHNNSPNHTNNNSTNNNSTNIDNNSTMTNNTIPGYGVFYVDDDFQPDNDTSWVFARKPDYVTSRKDVKVILNWYSMHIPWGDGAGGGSANEIVTAEELNYIENQLRTIPTQNFWGTLWFGSEEHRLTHFDNFNDDVNTTWFNERILGYPLYLKEAPRATREVWADEMMLRLMRGACDYWHSKGLKVGVMMGGGTLVDTFRDLDYYGGPSATWGMPAYNYWRNNFDFCVMYPFTCNLEYYNTWTVQYWDVVERDLTKQIKFLIPPQSWHWNGLDAQDPRWVFEEAAVALELHWAFEHGYIVTPYEENTQIVKAAIKLYTQNMPFYYYYVEGKNLLTNFTGPTYGWVKIEQ